MNTADDTLIATNVNKRRDVQTARPWVPALAKFKEPLYPGAGLSHTELGASNTAPLSPRAHRSKPLLIHVANYLTVSASSSANIIIKPHVLEHYAN